MERAFSRHRERIAARHTVKTADALVRMVDDLGFCFAFTGESAYPIPAAFDHLDTRSDSRKWEWMWGWKDELAEKKRLYYGKLLVKKPTFVSMEMLPTFYATFGRAGDADDHLEDVRAGRLSEIARRVIEFLAVNGETQTKRMRSALGITSQEGKTDYAKAIEELQRLMYVARASSADAMTALLAHLLHLAGGMSEAKVTKLFDWSEDRVAHTARRLELKKALVRTDGLLVLPTLG